MLGGNLKHAEEAMAQHEKLSQELNTALSERDEYLRQELWAKVGDGMKGKAAYGGGCLTPPHLEGVIRRDRH